MDQFTQFNQLIDEQVKQIGDDEYTSLIAFNNKWKEYLYEQKEFPEAKILYEFQSKIENLENFIEDCFINLELHHLFQLGIVSYLFGIIVPIKIIELGFSPFLDSFHAQFPHHLSCQFLFGLLKIMRIHELYEVDILSQKIATFQSTQNLEKFALQLFDRQFIDCQIIMKGKNKVQDFEQITERYNKLQNIAVTDLNNESLKGIKKFIDFQNDTIAKEIQTKKQNEEYSKIFNLEDVQVATSLTSLLERDRFILHESLLVQEGQYLEFKDLITLDSKRQFIIKKAITAFMNSQGGYLFIGVHDTLKVKGFQVKESNLLNTIEQQCIQPIHPSLVKGSDYEVALLPMYTGAGVLIKGLVIIKISLDRNPSSQSLYSFNEMNYDYQAECIFCFQRINDESKAIRSHQFKQLVLSLHKNDAQDSLLRRKYRKNEVETGIVQESSKLRTEDIWKIEQKEYVIIRKVKGPIDVLINIIQSIKDDSLYIQNFQLILNNIIIKMNVNLRGQLIEQINDQLCYITLTKQENISLQFYHGPVQTLLMKNEFNQQEIDKFQMSIATELNLNNFQIEAVGKYLEFKANYMKDLIKIYKYLKNQQKVKIEIHWRLEDGQIYEFTKE